MLHRKKLLNDGPAVAAVSPFMTYVHKRDIAENAVGARRGYECTSIYYPCVVHRPP